MMDPVTLQPAAIDQLLGRLRRPDALPDQVPVDEFFQQILRIADRFVPAEAGWVLIDDPEIKMDNSWNPGLNELVFVACYGDESPERVGQRLKASQGIAGLTYVTGQPCIIADATKDERLADIGAGPVTRSLVSVPIQIGRSVCGVLQLVNRRDRGSFEDRDLELLLIFAGYISTSLQNVLDANRYRELSKRDDLTGLYNDRYFNVSLSEQIELVEQTEDDLGLIFLDLDRFKEVNDKHGHLVGSQTLREVGLILDGVVTPDEAIVARYGGDEFVMVVPGADEDKTYEIAEKIREKIEKTAFRIDQDIEGSGVLMISGVITASIGVASYRQFDFAEDTRISARKNAFIRAADQAMYRAKSEGKNKVRRGSPEKAVAT